jgi:integrase/recombinase XerD
MTGGKRVAGTPPANKGGKYPPVVLSPEEVSALLATCSREYPSGIRNRALIMLLYRSGLRVSEILGLRPSELDFDVHSVTVPHTKSGKQQIRGFHPTTDDALLRWIDTRKALGIGNHGRKLFCTITTGNTGNPVSDVYVRKMLKEAARDAGIDKRVVPHGLRHTFAKELEAAGVPVSEISDLLGHAGGVASTAKYLRNLTNHRAVKALSEVDLPEVGGVADLARIARQVREK